MTLLRTAMRLTTPIGAIVRGVVQDRRAVAGVLREIVRRLGVRVPQAALTIPSEHLFVRCLDLPMMPPDALRAATRFEAKKYLPYPVENAEVEILAMPGPAKGADQKLSAILIAAPKEVVQSRAEALEMAGLEVARMDAEPFCLLRALDLGHEARRNFWRDQPVAYVHLGEETSSLAIIQDAALRFVHPIAWGGARLTQALAMGLGIEPAKATAIKESPETAIEADGTLCWENGQQRSGALVAELDRLRRELQRLMNYYSSLFPESSYQGMLNRCVLSGGTACLHGLDAYLSSILQVRSRGHAPLSTVARALPEDTQKLLKEHAPVYAVALGAALGVQPERGRTYVVRHQPTQPTLWAQKAA